MVCVCGWYQFSWLTVLLASFFSWENIPFSYESKLHEEAQHQHSNTPRHCPTVGFEDRSTKLGHNPIFLYYQIIKTHSLKLCTPRMSSECPGGECLLQCWDITSKKYIYFCKNTALTFDSAWNLDTCAEFSSSRLSALRCDAGKHLQFLNFHEGGVCAQVKAGGAW